MAGAGVLITLAGPGPIDAQTSKDGYLRRAGLDPSLVDAYRERFRLRAARYVQWVAVPLAILGAADTGGFLRRFLASWLAVMAAAIPVGWITGWFPPDRIVTFGFAVPIGAGLGLVWLRRRLGGRPWLARALVAALAGWMILGALIAWGRQAPFITEAEAATATEAAGIAMLSGPGTPIIFPVDDGDPTSTFLAARAANIARSALPPASADDVYVFVGSVTDLLEHRATERGDPEFDALSRFTLASIPGGREPLVIVLEPFYRLRDAASDPRLSRWAPGVWTTLESDLTPLPIDTSDDPLRFETTSPVATIAGTLAILILMTVLGLGYARSVFDDIVTALAAAPAFGTASLTLAAVVLDSVGLRLQGSGVALAASALAALGGVALLLATKRTRANQPAA